MRKVPSKSKLKWIQSNSGKKKLKFVRRRLGLSNALSHLQSLCLSLSVSHSVLASVSLPLFQPCSSLYFCARAHYANGNFNPPWLITQTHLGSLFLRVSESEVHSVFQYPKWMNMDVKTAAASQW